MTVKLVLNDKPSWSSSNYLPYNSSPVRLTDGNSGQTGQAFFSGCWASNNEKRPWWAVDLGQPEFVEYVEIIVRTDCCCKWLYNGLNEFVARLPMWWL